jgi:hypothetical protein
VAIDIDLLAYLLAKNIAEDANVTLSPKIYCQCCGMQLRGSLAEREFKEKVYSKKKKERKRKLRLGIVLKSPRLHC